MKRALLVIILASMPAFQAQSADRGKKARIFKFSVDHQTASQAGHNPGEAEEHARREELDRLHLIRQDVRLLLASVIGRSVDKRSGVRFSEIIETEVSFRVSRTDRRDRRSHWHAIRDARKAQVELEASTRDAEISYKQFFLVRALLRDKIDVEPSFLDKRFNVLRHIEFGVPIFYREKAACAFERSYQDVSVTHAEWLDDQELIELLSSPGLDDNRAEIAEELKNAASCYDQLHDKESYQIYREVLRKANFVLRELARRNRAVEVVEQKAEN